MKISCRFLGILSFGRRLIFCILPALAWSAAWSVRAEEFFNFAEFKAATAFTIPRDETEKEKAVSGNAGLRLSFRDADFRGYVTLPKTELKQIDEAEDFSEKLDLLDEPRLGAGLYFFKKTFPTAIKIGHNSFSKSVARMKNPAPAVTANPLAKSFAFSTGFGAALPTLTSSRQPLSYSICARTDEKIFPVQFGAEGFFNEDKECAGCFSAKKDLGRSVFVQAVLSIGRFYIEENLKILKKNNADFKADFFNVLLSEFCLHSPFLKLNFHSGIHENPYQVNPFWFKIDGRTSFRALLVNFSYFAIPTTKDSPKVAPLIGSSGITRTVEQASVNPQILFLFDDRNASSLRLGFAVLENWKVTATNTPVQLNLAKVRAAASYESRFFDLRLDWTHANILLDGEPPTNSARPEEYYSYTASSSLAGRLAKISVSGSYTNYPPLTEKAMLKEVYSASAKIAVPKANLTGQAGVDLTMKDGQRHSGEINAGVSYCLKKKYFRSSMKIAFVMPF